MLSERDVDGVVTVRRAVEHTDEQEMGAATVAATGTLGECEVLNQYKGREVLSY